MTKNQIERLANRIIRGETIKKPTKKDEKVFAEEMREARKYANRIKKYKEITGLQRISKESRSALFDYTASEVAKSRSMTQKQLSRRIANYEKKYGEATLDAINQLRYGTPKSVAKKIGAYNSSEPEKTKTGKMEDDGYARYSDLPTSTFSWYQIPQWIRRWKRTHGTFMYNNADVLFTGANIRIPEDLDRMTSGNDWNLWQFVEAVINSNPHLKNLYYNHPEGHWDEIYLIPKREWENTESLHPNWKTNMLYRPKDWGLVNENNRQ